jgi:hypothetical protein
MKLALKRELASSFQFKAVEFFERPIAEFAAQIRQAGKGGRVSLGKRTVPGASSLGGRCRSGHIHP